jgi:hypothetical protein
MFLMFIMFPIPIMCYKYTYCVTTSIHHVATNVHRVFHVCHVSNVHHVVTSDHHVPNLRHVFNVHHVVTIYHHVATIVHHVTYRCVHRIVIGVHCVATNAHQFCSLSQVLKPLFIVSLLVFIMLFAPILWVVLPLPLHCCTGEFH